MQYVKIIGDSHADAMKKLRDTYGSEAFIYHEKEIPAKTMFSRIVGKKQFEIQAALIEKKDTSRKSSMPAPSRINESEKIIPVKIHEVEVMPDRQTKSASLSTRSSQSIAPKKHAGEDFLALLDKEGITESRKKFNLEEISIEKNPVRGPVKDMKELGEIRVRSSKAPDTLTLDHLQSDLNEIKEKISILIKSPVYSESKNEIDRLKENLFEQEFTAHWITEFIQNIKQGLAQSDWNISTKVYLKAREILSSHIKVNPAMGSRRVIVLLGPTGVGKTTTIAKLAARLKLQENKKVTLITLDNYRIAATEQLKVYGDIMDIPVFVIKDPDKFRKKIAEDSADYILVDTTGFSHNNREFLVKQKAYFEGLEQEMDKHLVLAATSKLMDANHVIEKFSEYKINKIILSKVDETIQTGGFVELAQKWNLPFSFYTNGQRVPDDYLEAEKNYLSDKILFRLKEKCMVSHQE